VTPVAAAAQTQVSFKPSSKASSIMKGGDSTVSSKREIRTGGFQRLGQALTSQK